MSSKQVIKQANIKQIIKETNKKQTTKRNCKRVSGSGRKGAVEVIRDFIPQPPGCRQGTSLAQVAWHNCTAAKRGPFGPENFGSTSRPRGRDGASAWRRGDKRACVHAITARTVQSRHARHGHRVHASVTARTLWSRRARFGHGAHASVTARAQWSRRARLDRCAHGAARQALWTQRARRPRRGDYYGARSGAGSEAAAGGGS
jgi:hypothetical protein